MGNQTSQWFALYYLDPLDRLAKEKLRIKHYTRYMDDMILVHPSKEVLVHALKEMWALLHELQLEFNEKTQVFPIKHSVENLGWCFYPTDTGAMVHRLRTHSKIRWRHRMRKLTRAFDTGQLRRAELQGRASKTQNKVDCHRASGERKQEKGGGLPDGAAANL